MHRVVVETVEIELKRASQLLDHYGLDPKDANCWLVLSLNLARDFVRGFKAGPKPRKRASKSWFAVVGEVDILHAKRGMSLRKACQHLYKNTVLPSQWKYTRPDTLLTRYGEFKKRIQDSPGMSGLYGIWIKAMAQADESQMRDLIPEMVSIFEQAPTLQQK